MEAHLDFSHGTLLCCLAQALPPVLPHRSSHQECGAHAAGKTFLMGTTCGSSRQAASHSLNRNLGHRSMTHPLIAERDVWLAVQHHLNYLHVPVSTSLVHRRLAQSRVSGVDSRAFLDQQLRRLPHRQHASRLEVRPPA
eukprot:744612-Rhodomonas_salina.1